MRESETLEDDAPPVLGSLQGLDARWAWVAITALAFLLRVYRLGHQSLWMDEVLTATNADRPFWDLLFDPTVDRNFPPLYNVVVHLIQQGLGRSDVLLRLPSAIAGALTVPVVYWSARGWLGKPIALVGAFLLAISPLHVWYSQEARPYALLVLFAMTTLWAARRSVECPGARGWLVGFVAAGAATFYTHLVAAPFLVVCAGYLLLKIRPADRTRAVAAVLALALVVLPQLISFTATPPTLSGNTAYRFELTHLGYTAWAFTTGYSLGPSLLELRQGLPAIRPYFVLILSVLLLALILFGFGGRLLWRISGEALLFLTGWIGGPVAFAVLGSMVSSHPFNVRYAILALPPVLLVMATGLSGVTPALVRHLLAGAWITVAAASLFNYYHTPKYHREDNRAAARFLNANVGKGELVLATAPYTVLPLRYYGLRGDLELRGYPKSGMLAEGQAARELDGLLQQRSRVWLFLSRTFHSDPGGQIVRHLETRYALEREFSAAGVRVLLYSREPSGAPSGKLEHPAPAEGRR